MSARLSGHAGQGRLRALPRVIGRRLMVFIPIMLLVTAGIFALATLSPLDPLDSYLNGQAASLTPELRDQMRHDVGLDRPWWQAWLVWLGNLVQGNPGQSIVYHQSVAQVISERFFWTLALSGIGLTIGIVVSVLLGVWSALHPGSPLDRAVGSFVTLTQAIPPFLLGIGMISLFAVALHVLPSGGLTDPGREVTGESLLRHLVLPSTVFATSQLPWLTLGLRETMLRTLRDDAIVFARLRGIPRRTIVTRHVLPMAAPPFVALVATRLPELVAGSAVVEAVFSWPGLGSAMVVASQRLDFALLCTLAAATTALVLLSTLLADVIFVALDPRVSDDL